MAMGWTWPWSQSTPWRVPPFVCHEQQPAPPDSRPAPLVSQIVSLWIGHQLVMLAFALIACAILFVILTRIAKRVNTQGPTKVSKPRIRGRSRLNGIFAQRGRLASDSLVPKSRRLGRVASGPRSSCNLEERLSNVESVLTNVGSVLKALQSDIGGEMRSVRVRFDGTLAQIAAIRTQVDAINGIFDKARDASLDCLRATNDQVSDALIHVSAILSAKSAESYELDSNVKRLRSWIDSLHSAILENARKAEEVAALRTSCTALQDAVIHST